MHNLCACSSYVNTSSCLACGHRSGRPLHLRQLHKLRVLLLQLVQAVEVARPKGVVLDNQRHDARLRGGREAGGRAGCAGGREREARGASRCGAPKPGRLLARQTGVTPSFAGTRHARPCVLHEPGRPRRACRETATGRGSTAPAAQT